MTTPNLEVRRATIEDFPGLNALWKTEGLAGQDLETRFKEFQVVVDDQGQIHGTLGLQIERMEGCLHSEAFAHPEEADHMRDLLLRRMQILMTNHGLFRVWTQLATPFWHTNGFQEVNDELLAKRPAGFTGSEVPWLSLQLKEEPANAAPSLDKEFALFKEAEKERTEKIYRQAKALKIIAAVIAAAVFILIVISLTILFLKTKAGQQRQGSSRGALPACVMAAEPHSLYANG